MKKIPNILSKKKLIACFLSVIMICGMSVFSFAEEDAVLAEETAVTTEGVIDDDALLAEDEKAAEEKTADSAEAEKVETKEQTVSTEKENEKEQSKEQTTENENEKKNENEKEAAGKENAQLLADTVKVEFYGKVTLEGKTLEEGQFTIVSEDSTDSKKTETTNDKDGNFYYSVELPDGITEHHYKITEKLTKTDNTINVASESYDISVTIKDGSPTVKDNTHNKNLTQNQDSRFGPIEFSNSVKASVNSSANPNTTVTYKFEPIVKLDSKLPTANRFSFYLKETTQGNASLSGTLTAKNDANGKVSFPAITYNKEGTYTYEIGQETSTISGIKKDTALYKAEVTVSKDSDGNLKANLSKLTKGNTTITSPSNDKIVFDNTSTNSTTTTTNTNSAKGATTTTSKGPSTGDSSDIGLFTALLVGFVVVLIGTLLSFRRRKTTRK
jgi:pilin isopeptide linkage protein